MTWAQVGGAGLDHGPIISSAEYWSEEAINDSDKSLSVNTDLQARMVRVDGIRVEFTASATIGTRQFSMEVQDGSSDVIYSQNFSAATDTAAGASTTWEAIPGEAAAAAIDGGPLTEFMPREFWLGRDAVLRIYERDAIDAAADDMTIHLRLSVRR